MRSFAVLAALAYAIGANAQVTDSRIIGTWASGSRAVSTGGNFCNPAEMTFTYPANTGISYSFSEDGFFEEAQYRYDSNATNPTCIRGKIIWQHGTYVINSDGSLDLTPFSTDGRIQVQDPCAAVTNVVTYYDETEKMRSYDVYVDQVSASYTLQLYQFDGTPMPPMYQTANPPNMMPTSVLTGVNATGQTVAKRDFEEELELEKRSSSGATALSLAPLATIAFTVLAAAIAL